jgi:hypothetical protein
MALTTCEEDAGHDVELHMRHLLKIPTEILCFYPPGGEVVGGPNDGAGTSGIAVYRLDRLLRSRKYKIQNLQCGHILAGPYEGVTTTSFIIPLARGPILIHLMAITPPKVEKTEKVSAEEYARRLAGF